MPTETLITVIAIIVPFALFAAVLAYADYHSSTGRADRLRQ